MGTRDRDRTAPRPWNVLRAVAAATLLLSAAAEAANGPAPASNVKPVSAKSASAPAVHDSARATSAVPALSADEPPPPAAPIKAFVKTAVKPAASPVAPAAPATKSPGNATASKASPKPAAPAVGPAAAQAWHPPLAPPVGSPVASGKPAASPAAPTAAVAKPATPAVAPVVSAAGSKPAASPAVAVPAPGTLVKLPVAGTTMPAAAPNKTNLIVKPGTAPAPGPTPALPAQPARTNAPGTLPSPAGGLANTAGKSGLPGGFTTVSPTMSASNPAFIGPPAPPALLAKNAAAAAAIAAARPNHAGAVAASTQPMAVSMKPVAGPSVSHLDEHLTYQYNALGRRDPFQPLIGGSYVSADEGGNALPDVGGLRIVGIVWGTDDQFAMAEDSRGQSMVLRRGDKVMNGVVEALKRDGVVINLTVDGQSQSVVVPLTKKGDH